MPIGTIRGFYPVGGYDSLPADFGLRWTDRNDREIKMCVYVCLHMGAGVLGLQPLVSAVKPGHVVLFQFAVYMYYSNVAECHMYVLRFISSM